MSSALFEQALLLGVHRRAVDCQPSSEVNDYKGPPSSITDRCLHFHTTKAVSLFQPHEATGKKKLEIKKGKQVLSIELPLSRLFSASNHSANSSREDGAEQYLALLLVKMRDAATSNAKRYS